MWKGRYQPLQSALLNVCAGLKQSSDYWLTFGKREKIESKGQENYETLQIIRNKAKPLISPNRLSALVLEVWEEINESLMWPFQPLTHTHTYAQNPLENLNKQAVMRSEVYCVLNRLHPASLCAVVCRCVCVCAGIELSVLQSFYWIIEKTEKKIGWQQAKTAVHQVLIKTLNERLHTRCLCCIR